MNFTGNQMIFLFSFLYTHKNNWWNFWKYFRVTGEEIISFFEEGLIKPSPSMIVGFHEVNKALKFLSEMKACGKVCHHLIYF